MRALFLVLAMLCLAPTLTAQYVYTIKADSVKITNNCDTAELIIENHTQNVLGFLYNKGKGRTEFRKAEKLNDSTLVFGDDTLVIKGSGVSIANNGLSINGNIIQLGQSLESEDNLTEFTEARVIPTQGFPLILRGNSNDSMTLGPFYFEMTRSASSPFAPSIRIANPSYEARSSFTPSSLDIDRDGTGSSISLYTDPIPSISISETGMHLLYQSGELAITSDSASQERLATLTLTDREESSGSRLFSSFVATPTSGQIYFSNEEDTILIKAYPAQQSISIGNGTNLYAVFDKGLLSVKDSLLVGTLRTGSPTDSLVVHDNNTKALKKISQSSISNTIYRVSVNDNNYNASASDYLISFVSLTTGRTITLPAANTMSNKTIIIKDESGSAATHNITVDGFGSETIDGAATKTISSNFGSLTVYSNGASWFTLHQ